MSGISGYRTWCRLGALGLWAGLGTGCSGEGFIRVTLRNEDSRPIYLCSPVEDDQEECGIAQITNLPPPDRAFLDAGRTREVLLEMNAGALDGTFYAVRERGFDCGGRTCLQYELQSIATCRTIADFEDLRASRPEVVWTGTGIQCRNWLF
jgi:hypothetical protein